MPSKAGSPQETLRAALDACPALGLHVVAVSPFYQTPCFPPGAGPDYINAAAIMQTDLTPHGVIEAFHKIEEDFARSRDTRWGMRTLDMDLLSYDDRVVPDKATFDHWRTLDPVEQMRAAPDQLILPHPRIQDRAFVLVPLCDIAPDWRHPVLGKTAQQMLDALPEEDLEEITRV